MTNRKTMLALFATVAIAAGGCAGDMARQIVSNEQFRGQVLDVIATHRSVALQAVDRIVSSDSLRASVVDHLLQNDNVAKQVIVRIATNPDAIDMVLGAAVRDSAMRVHVMTLMKGMQMANAK